jgi:GntR family transcriptional regulator
VTASTDDSGPSYLYVARHLRRQILSGDLHPGERLPPARELAKSFGVAPNTVLSAVKVLREEGLVSSQQGRGVFVRSTQPSPTQASRDFEQLMSQLKQFEYDLLEMRRRLGRLEDAAARMLGEDHPAP